MDKTLYLINLYDYYGELLTERQREYFEDYYFDNLSLSEISENMEISRNAVHKALKDTENKLIYYESILKDYEKSKRIKEIIKDLDDEIKHKIEEII